jgi:hypothetical protein
MYKPTPHLVCLFVWPVAIACGGDTAGSSEKARAAMVGQSCEPTGGPSGNFSASEVTVEEQPACGEGLCVVVHFEGRVSCPYGQDANGGECQTASGAAIEGAVPPQLVARPPSDAIYCSCRCDGPDGADLCACPAGFECRPLIHDIGLAQAAAYAGSYCIKAGTFVEDPNALGAGPRCDFGAGNCEGR